MELFIIDIEKERTRIEENLRLLWTSVLVSEFVSATNCLAEFISFTLALKDCDEQSKFTLYADWIKSNPNWTKEHLDTFHKNYSTLINARKLKGKSKEIIIAIKRIEKGLNKCFSDYEDFILASCRNNKIAELLPLANIDWDEHMNNAKPLYVWVPEEDREAESFVKNISERLTKPFIIPLFDNSVHDNLLVTSMERAEKGGFISKLGNVLCDFLFEIPEPFTLNTSQILMVRNDFSKSAWKFFEEAGELFHYLADVPFTEKNYSEIAELYHKHLTPLKPAMQVTAEECEILTQLKKDMPAGKAENPSAPTLKLYCGITSFNTILSYYIRQNIIGENELLYIKEEINGFDLANARLFLFLSH